MSESLWTDTAFRIASYDVCDIPWVPTYSMSNALSKRYNAQNEVQWQGPLLIHDWMKEIEINRYAPRWGFDEIEGVLYLEMRNVDVFSDTLWEEDEVNATAPPTAEQWDMEVDIIETWRMMENTASTANMVVNQENPKNMLSFITDFNMPILCM